MMEITGWGVFWLFMCLFFICDTFLYYKGHDTFFWEHKTPAELELQKNIIAPAKTGDE